MSWKNCDMESVAMLAGCLRLADGGGVYWEPHLSPLCDSTIPAPCCSSLALTIAHILTALYFCFTLYVFTSSLLLLSSILYEFILLPNCSSLIQFPIGPSDICPHYLSSSLPQSSHLIQVLNISQSGCVIMT